jgi:hypothetical protein
MTETKGLTISGRNLAVWVVIATIIVSSIVDSALTRSQVQDNTLQLKTYNLSVISYKMDEMDKKLTHITDLLEQ